MSFIRRLSSGGRFESLCSTIAISQSVPQPVSLYNRGCPLVGGCIIYRRLHCILILYMTANNNIDLHDKHLTSILNTYYKVSTLSYIHLVILIEHCSIFGMCEFVHVSALSYVEPCYQWQQKHSGHVQYI